MAKRRRKKPNISQTVLDQARQGVVDEGGSAAAPTRASTAPASDTAAAKPQPRRRRALQAAQLERRKGEGALDGEYVADLYYLDR